MGILSVILGILTVLCFVVAGTFIVIKIDTGDGPSPKTTAIGGCVCGVLFIISMCFSRIAPGEVGVVVNLFGSKKGVEETELTVGYHFIKPWESLYKFPIFEQNHQWDGTDRFNFQTAEGLTVNADIGINFHLVPNRIHELFCKYRRGMDEITHLFIRNNIRDAINKAACKMKIEELIGPKKEEFFAQIQKEVAEELEPLGFNITHIFLIGSFDVPDTVIKALNLKIEASQRAQQRENELREAEAEAKKQIAAADGQAKSQLIRAKGEAESNAMVSRSLTPELLQWQSINKWNGVLPATVAGEDIPFIIQGSK